MKLNLFDYAVIAVVLIVLGLAGCEAFAVELPPLPPEPKAVAIPPSLSIRKQSGVVPPVAVTWTGTGYALMNGPTCTGPWSLLDAPSPYIPVNVSPQFFRLARLPSLAGVQGNPVSSVNGWTWVAPHPEQCVELYTPCKTLALSRYDGTSNGTLVDWSKNITGTYQWAWSSGRYISVASPVLGYAETRKRVEAHTVTLPAGPGGVVTSRTTNILWTGEIDYDSNLFVSHGLTRRDGTMVFAGWRNTQWETYFWFPQVGGGFTTLKTNIQFGTINTQQTALAESNNKSLCYVSHPDGGHQSLFLRVFNGAVIHRDANFLNDQPPQYGGVSTNAPYGELPPLSACADDISDDVLFAYENMVSWTLPPGQCQTSDPVDKLLHVTVARVSPFNTVTFTTMPNDIWLKRDDGCAISVHRGVIYLLGCFVRTATPCDNSRAILARFDGAWTFKDVGLGDWATFASPRTTRGDAFVLNGKLIACQ